MAGGGLFLLCPLANTLIVSIQKVHVARNVPSVTVTMKSYPERDSGNDGEDGEDGVTMRLTNKLGVTSEIK